MGNFLRLAVFVVLLGTLAAGTAALLLQERRRGQELERLAEAGSPTPLETVRAHQTRAHRSLLLLSGLALASLTILALVPASSSAPPQTESAALVRGEMRGLEILARTTNAQRLELDQERETRHRSEQDLHLQQVLANRALQHKVRLGRDLHEDLVQTLHATGLVLESARRRLDSSPPETTEAAMLLSKARENLDAAIRQTRDTIGGLTQDARDGQSFASAVAAILAHLDVGSPREHAITIAPAVPAFDEPTRTELLQIIRESAINALRHGLASRLDIRFAPLPDGRLRLVVRDDGRGFDVDAVTRGHGLDNIAARARSLGAILEIDSAPGRGASVTLTLPPPAS
jgi:signal transduction histidine kinase